MRGRSCLVHIPIYPLGKQRHKSVKHAREFVGIQKGISARQKKGNVVGQVCIFFINYRNHPQQYICRMGWVTWRDTRANNQTGRRRLVSVYSLWAFLEPPGEPLVLLVPPGRLVWSLAEPRRRVVAANAWKMNESCPSRARRIDCQSDANSAADCPSTVGGPCWSTAAYRAHRAAAYIPTRLQGGRRMGLQRYGECVQYCSYFNDTTNQGQSYPMHPEYLSNIRSVLKGQFIIVQS